MIYSPFSKTDEVLNQSNSPFIDAFARLRVASPKTIFDSKQIYDNQPLYWDEAETSGSGTSTAHSTATASTTMSVSASTAGTRVRQTKRRFNYQPGKSQFILLTGILGSGSTGITRRIGYFDENNGLFFQISGTTLSVVRRTYTGGSPSDDAVAQSNWILDKMDGTGPSGVTIDTSKTQIFVIDFEWLGVGRVRFGFVIDGIIIYCHELLHSNIFTTVYMSTPNLPLRYEISNGGTGGVASIVHICSSVISEGGTEDTGTILSVGSNNTHVDANVAGTVYACLGLKLKSTHLSQTVEVIGFSILGSTANDNFMWLLYINPTIAGSFTYSDYTNGAVQFARGATANTVTNGTLLDSGYIPSQGSTKANFKNSVTLGSTISGTADAIVLCVMPIGGASNLDIYASMTWREAS